MIENILGKLEVASIEDNMREFGETEFEYVNRNRCYYEMETQGKRC